MAAENGKWLAILPLLFLLFFLSCSVDGPPASYERILIDTYEPNGGFPLGGFPADTYLSLYDSSGSLLDEDDNSNTDKTTDPETGETLTDQTDSSRIDYTDGLSSGTYYIKVTIGSSSQTTGNFALRVLALTLSDSIPIPVYPVSVDFSKEADYELLDAPEEVPPFTPLSERTVSSIALGTDDFGRILDSAGDVDWLVFVLP